MSQPKLKTRRELVTDAIRRMLTYTTELTWFGPNSVGLAIATMTAGLVSSAYRLYKSLIRRITLLASSGSQLTKVAEERGASRLDAQRARLLVVVAPHTSLVTELNGPKTLIEVANSDEFTAGASIRIRSEDGSVSETATIIAITVGTGPNGNDELQVAALANAYAPTTEDVLVLLRHTLPIGTVVGTSTGVNFETVLTVTTGDANAVLDGESTFLGLADKVWCECQTAGAAGKVSPKTVTDLVPSVAEVARVFNPESGVGGEEEETDYDLKFRASHGPVAASQETFAWLGQLARKGERDVLRAIRTNTNTISTMAVKVLHRNGGPLGTSQRVALQAYIQDRVRSHLLIEVTTITLTSVEVSAQITLNQDANLKEVWREAATRLGTLLDYRKWEFGVFVDEAELLSIVKKTPGVATLNTGTFTPTTDVPVGDESLPTLVRLTLEDTATGRILGADLTVSF